MNERNDCSDEELIEGVDALHSHVSAGQRELLRAIAEVDRREAWRDSGARDMAHWLSIRYGISCWKAGRWIQAAHAIEGLAHISEAFSRGELGIDKVVELTRFATAQTEARLIEWAKGVSGACIRRKADLTLRRSVEEIREAEETRSLSWWYLNEGRRFGLQAELPAAQGAVVAKALERLADTLPVMPGEEGAHLVDARRADALVALCSTRIAEDADPDRATVVVHAQLGALVGDDPGCEIEGGPAIDAETARRLLCHARSQTVIEDRMGEPIGFGRVSREPSASMMRQLRYRDFGCTFPGCGDRRFAQAHHVVWWRHGGRTDLDNLLLVCTFHHRLVHEHGWTVRREPDGTTRWFHPDGRRHEVGPAPPREAQLEPPPEPQLERSGSSQVISVNRAKSVSAEHRVVPCSIASASSCASGTRLPRS